MKQEYDFTQMRRRENVSRDLPAPELLDRHIRIRTRLILDKDVLDWCKVEARSRGEKVSQFLTNLLRAHKEALHAKEA